jgi:hypothetical protein
MEESLSELYCAVFSYKNGNTTSNMMTLKIMKNRNKIMQNAVNIQREKKINVLPTMSCSLPITPC